MDGTPPYHAFPTLDCEGVRHGVFGRAGGTSRGYCESLNVGHTVGDDPVHLETNHARIYTRLGAQPESVVAGRQVHGNRVAVVSRADGGRVLDATDALISNVPGVHLMLRFADCVPILLLAPEERAIGIAHAGWRGTLQKVAGQAVVAMERAYGCRADQIRAAIGPSIGPCCFEVGPKVVEEARRAFGDSPQKETRRLVSREQANGKAHLDLWLANALQLRELGVRSIETAQVCTMCHADAYFSHRATGGRTGRFAALIGLRGEWQPRAPAPLARR